MKRVLFALCAILFFGCHKKEVEELIVKEPTQELNLPKSVTLYNGNGEFSNNEKYKYNADGFVIQEIDSFSWGTKIVHSYSYDNGLLIGKSSISIGKSGNTDTIFSYKLKYDTDRIVEINHVGYKNSLGNRIGYKALFNYSLPSKVGIQIYSINLRINPKDTIFDSLDVTLNYRGFPIEVKNLGLNGYAFSKFIARDEQNRMIRIQFPSFSGPLVYFTTHEFAYNYPKYENLIARIYKGSGEVQKWSESLSDYGFILGLFNNASIHVDYRYNNGSSIFEIVRNEEINGNISKIYSRQFRQGLQDTVQYYSTLAY